MSRHAIRVGARARTAPVVGSMNKTESRRAERLRELKMLGEVHDFRFEALKLRLGDNTFLTPDFFVIRTDGRVELEDVKGRKGDGYYITEDARVKLYCAAQMYPWFVFLIVWESRSGVWMRKEVAPV